MIITFYFTSSTILFQQYYAIKLILKVNQDLFLTYCLYTAFDKSFNEIVWEQYKKEQYFIRPLGKLHYVID